MVIDTEKKSQSRIFIAIALFLASIATSFLIAFISSQGISYWVVREAIPQGVRITSEDVTLVQIKLGRTADGYLKESTSPIGSITQRALARGEVLHRSALAHSTQRESSGSVSLAIRSSDIPPSVKIGDFVSIYQVHDVRNGETSREPQLVLPHLFLENISSREGNFSGELSLTVSLDQRDIPSLLAATTSGRLVIVGISG